MDPLFEVNEWQGRLNTKQKKKKKVSVSQFNYENRAPTTPSTPAYSRTLPPPLQKQSENINLDAATFCCLKNQKSFTCLLKYMCLRYLKMFIF